MNAEASGRLPRRALVLGFAVLITAQAFVAFMGVADFWTRGHNGWNGAAYHLSARNTLRWGLLFPLQYDTGVTPPPPDEVYTHHPLAMHLHNTASLWLFGDHPAAIRGVAALHGVLALAMLLLFVRRWWDDVHALVAGAVYLVLPINAIYINMANHSSGFIFWSLLALHCYLTFDERIREEGPHPFRWYGLTLATFFLASQWDWPAYYVAFGIALHWLVAGVARLRHRGRAWWRWDRHLFALVGFGLFVLALFGGHWLLVKALTHNVGELEGTIRERTDIPWARFAQNLRVVPPLMFTWPVLGLCAAWLVGWSVRLVRGRARPRDVAPLVYGIGGAIHYVVFKWSAIVHSYWAWTALPFVAMACAATTVGAGRWLVARATPRLGRGRALLVGALVGLVFVPLVVRSIEIVPPARHYGGSMWWVAPVRGPVSHDYRSGRPELRFARQVREWTDRHTGVLVHRSITALNPEPRFDTTLDRETARTFGLPDRGPSHPGIDGWVVIGVVGSVPFDRIVQAAARHPYFQYGRFFMIDLRRSGPDVRVYDLRPAPRSLAYAYFMSPFDGEGPVQPVRSEAAEREIREAVRARAAAGPHATSR